MTTIYNAIATQDRDGWLLHIPALDHTERIEARDQVEANAQWIVGTLGEVTVEWQ